MPREIVLGNQCMLVNIDKWLQIRDLFYPHVGEENHVQGYAHKIGVFVDNQISWVNEDAWQRDMNYDEDTLASHASATNPHLGIKIQFHDCVLHNKHAFLRKATVKNNSDREREVKVFTYQDFHIYGTDIGDTAGYDAHRNSVFHYKRKRYFMANMIHEETCASCNQKGDVSDYTVGESGGEKGTWLDAEDGKLEGNPIAQGNVDSTIGITLRLKPGEEKSFYYWIACGKDREEVIQLNDYLMEKHPENLFKEVKEYWKGVVEGQSRDFRDLGPEVEGLYKRSVLAVIANIDKGGAITAANDSDNMKFNRDTYSYCWPRDGALVAYALDKAGFHDYSRPFFEFCANVISGHGALLHKYNPDGSLGSSWHPWVKDGKPRLPIQEDETALTIWALWYHYEQTQDEEWGRKMYEELVVPAGDFMCRHRREDNLPLESYDLWEERDGIFTFTTSTAIGGLRAASNFARQFGDSENEEKYWQAAEKMKDALLEKLWDNGHQRFLKRIIAGEDKRDPTPESSTYGVFEFGVLPPDDERVVKNMESLKKELWMNTDVGGLARYSDDYYHRVSKDVPGNPWLITTMWYGKWLIKKASSMEELRKGKEIIDWIAGHCTHSGLLAEQVHPYSGEPLSVSPLTWSHATFLDIVNDYIWKYGELEN